MRAFGVVILIVALTVAVESSPASENRAGPARIRVADLTPLTLRGHGFVPREKVRLRVSLGERTVVRGLQANAGGAFVTEFDAIRYDRCQGSLAVKAVGTKGSRVSWELVPLDCPDDEDS